MKNKDEDWNKLRELYIELEDLAAEMNYAVDAIVVEGPHDKKTVRNLGYKNPIILCSQISKNKLADYAAEKFANIVILTDFDDEGNFLNKKLLTLFERKRLKVSRFYRRKFYKLLRKARMTTIEGIYNIKLKLFPS